MQKALDHLQAADPVLGGIIERVGPYRIEHRDPDFEGLARAIVYQQLSGKAAGTIYGRLVALTGSPLRPEAVLALSEEQMRAIGLSRQKASYVRDLAERTASAEVDFAAFPDMSDEEVIASLTRVKGVGVWTVHMFLIFALRRLNVLPTGDLGVRTAIQRAYRLRKPPTAIRMEKIARPWHPYCSVASWYLWRSLEL
jgi:DNA-3-methyladenine glycosylase II